jgi:hypothetical protein
MKLTYVFPILLLTGCTLAPLTQDQLTSMPLLEAYSDNGYHRYGDGTLCYDADNYLYDAETRLAMYQEIKARVTPQEYRDIRSLKPRIGMTERALACSMKGYAKNINVTTTKYGTSKQHVYGDVLSTPGATYVYTENGIVTTIQD